MILFLVASAFVYSKFLAMTGLPAAMANMAASAPLPPVMVLILILFVYFLLGLFIDGLALVLMTTPIFYPIIIQLGLALIKMPSSMTAAAVSSQLDSIANINVFIHSYPS